MPLHLLPLCSSQTNQHTKYKLCLFSWWAATFLMLTVPMWTLRSAHIGMQHGVVWGRKCHLFLFLKFLDATVTTINVELAIIILLFQDRTSPRTLLDFKVAARAWGGRVSQTMATIGSPVSVRSLGEMRCSLHPLFLSSVGDSTANIISWNGASFCNARVRISLPLTFVSLSEIPLS